MIFVYDATPLIYLGKVGVLRFLPRIKAKQIITPKVYQEVVIEGKRLKQPEALIVDILITEKNFRIASPSKIMEALNTVALEEADKEVLSLAYELHGRAVIDDLYCRNIADILGVQKWGSVALLFYLYKEHILKKSDVKKALDGMIHNGWRCSSELYVEILALLEKM